MTCSVSNRTLNATIPYFYIVTIMMMMMMMMMIDTEPAWIDVLLDLLMSSLSQDESLVRVVVNSAFVLLIPQFTTASIQLILDVSVRCHYGRDTRANIV